MFMLLVTSHNPALRACALAIAAVNKQHPNVIQTLVLRINPPEIAAVPCLNAFFYSNSPWCKS
jgi:hypothetical protein